AARRRLAIAHHAHELRRDHCAHAVVDATPGQDDLGPITDRFGLRGEIVGINPDAVAADEAGREFQEVPLGRRGVQHVLGADTEPFEDQRQLVHQRDVEVALGVFDDLGGFGGLYAGRTMDARFDHTGISGRHAFQDLRILARNDLGDPFQCVLAVARVDPFRRIAEPKISSALQSRYLFKYRPANFLRCTGIDRRFVDYDRTLGEGGAERARGADERTEIWP